MKFTLIAAAAGTVAAHHGQCPFHKFWHRRENNCPDRDNSKLMETHEFLRNAKKTMWENVIRGSYHDARDNVVDDMCMGAWMAPKSKQIHDTVHGLFHGGLWTVGHQEIKDASSALWDIILDNITHCDVYRFIYGQYDWCMKNIETCTHHHGIADRIIDHGFEVIGNAMKVHHEWKTNGDCFTDEQMLNKIGLMTEGVVSSIQTIRGFEGTWDRDAKIEHITFHDMHKNIHHLKDITPRQHEACPIKTVMQYFFGAEMVEMEKEIKETVFEFVTNPFHHKKTHHQSHHAQPPMMSWGFPFAFQHQAPMFQMPHITNPLANLHLF
jgi:flavodoxin